MKNLSTKVLIVDDDPEIIEILNYNLVNSGFITKSASNGLEAIKKAKKFIPDIILLDVMMPEMDGIEACIKIREIKTLTNTRIIFLSARGEDFTQIAAFDAGADDYISKPVKPKILLKKISSIAKRLDRNKNQIGILDLGEIIIDRESYLVETKPGKLFTREEIMLKVWGTEIFVGDRTIDVHIRKLRKKIGEKYIKTTKGVGYKFKK